MGLQGISFRNRTRKLMAMGLVALLAAPLMWSPSANAENETPASQLLRNKKANNQNDTAGSSANWSGAQTGGKATTETRIVNDGSVAPFLSASSLEALKAAETKFATIASNGGWGSVPNGRMKKGSTGKNVAALNKRLYAEGYLRDEGISAEFVERYTTATEDAVKRFQSNHGLFPSGSVDAATLKELNVPVSQRLATIRANIPRVAEYSKDLGSRYVVVNVPAAQIESVQDGRVYSLHNAIVGRTSRPTPVVITHLQTIRFNPYWNAPASIVEKDIIPRMLSSRPSKVLDQMNIKVFKGVGGPEIDPDTVNWRQAIADDYHFRQEPGGENAMKSAKIEFNSPFGIYLHDTPEPKLFESGQRFYSSGCVRVDKVEILLNWILNGQDGINNARIAELAESKERLDVELKDPPQIRVAYLTAWAGANGEVNFRPDVYGLDGSGFVTGQPLGDGEKQNGLPYVLKPIPRSPQAVEADEAFGFFDFLRNSRNSDKQSAAAALGAPKATSNFASVKTESTQRKSIFATSTDTKKKTTKTATKKKPKPTENAKVTSKSVVKSASGDVSAQDAAKTGKKKVASTSKTATTTKTAATAKTTTAKTTNTAAATAKTQPATKASSTKVASASAPADCKPAKDGKLPAGCKAPPAAKAKPKAPATTAAN